MSTSRDIFKFFRNLSFDLQVSILEQSDSRTLESLTLVDKSLSVDIQPAARTSKVVLDTLKDCLLLFKTLKKCRDTLPKIEEMKDMISPGIKQLYTVFYNHFEHKQELPYEEKIINLASQLSSQFTVLEETQENSGSWPATDVDEIVTHWSNAFQTIGRLKECLLQQEIFYNALLKCIEDVSYKELHSIDALLPEAVPLLQELKIPLTDSKHTNEPNHDSNELLKKVINLICETKNLFCIVPAFIALVYGKKTDLMQYFISIMKKYDALPIGNIRSACSAGLVSAAFYGHLETAQVLIPHCKKADPLCKRQALLNAVDINHLAIAQLLLEPDFGVDINGSANCTRYPEYTNALMLAAYLGRTEMVKLLITAKADPTIMITYQGQEGTALQFAEQQGHHEIVELLNIYEKEWQLQHAQEIAEGDLAPSPLHYRS